MKNAHIGSDFDDFLKEEGLQATVSARALKRCLILQIEEAMTSSGLELCDVEAAVGAEKIHLEQLFNKCDPHIHLPTIFSVAELLELRLVLHLDSAHHIMDGANSPTLQTQNSNPIS